MPDPGEERNANEIMAMNDRKYGVGAKARYSAFGRTLSSVTAARRGQGSRRGSKRYGAADRFSIVSSTVTLQSPLL